MPKKGFTTCPECGVEINTAKIGRHMRRVHPKKAAEHGVMEPRQTRRAKVLSPRKQELLDYRKQRELRKNAGVAVVVTIIVVAVIVTGYYWNTIIPHKHNPVAVVDTSMGTIKFVIYKDKVPKTADNFIKYADAHFYEGLIFHRITNLDTTHTETHIIQGGGMDANLQTKTALYPAIDLEIDNSLTHDDGCVAMARTNEVNSATSQFYICDGAEHFLDDAQRQANGQGQGYAVFGKVTDGMSVVRAMGKVQTQTVSGYDNVPVDPITINSVTIE
jgi:cyclophilin family peptidyl-prolyl cis-trans isomerase/predicted nucleic acid-binding Zn ribbon protein